MCFKPTLWSAKILHIGFVKDVIVHTQAQRANHSGLGPIQCVQSLSFCLPRILLPASALEITTEFEQAQGFLEVCFKFFMFLEHRSFSKRLFTSTEQAVGKNNKDSLKRGQLFL